MDWLVPSSTSQTIQPPLPYPEKTQNLDNTPFNQIQVPYRGYMRWNSTDKQPQNKDSLTKGHKTEIGKTHERYNERKPVSIFTDEIMAPSQFKH